MNMRNGVALRVWPRIMRFARKASALPIIPVITMTTLVTWSGAMSGCTGNTTPKPQYSLKQLPLALATSDLTRIEIIKSEKQSGERWTATLARSESDPKKWAIASSPGGSLGDRIASTGLINHLLDTLSTLQIKAIAPAGTPESFGLTPPAIGMKLTARDNKEILIGALATHAGADKSSRYAQLPPDATVYVVQGAALQMLDYIDSFNSLRQQAWLGEFDADDIDEIEIFEWPAAKKSLFYAQREGSVWTDRKSKPIPATRGDAQALLDHLAHARIRRFIDDPETNREVLTAIRKRPGKVIRLTHRGGKRVTELHAAWITVAGKESAYGQVDSRGDWAFELHPETLRLIEKQKK